MSIGYTARINIQNKQASGHMLGVKLGRLCIKYEIPVVEIAKEFKVSRQAVYNWFVGISQPRGRTKAKVTDYIAKLKAET